MIQPKTISTDQWGIMSGYTGGQGEWHPLSSRNRVAILKAMGVDSASEPPSLKSLRVLRPGQTLALSEPAELILEDGTRLPLSRRLPANLPCGYHDLHFLRSDRMTRLIISPQKCYLPARPRAWGWALQLYALRSQGSCGMGDLLDLKRFAAWSRKNLHTGFVLINPLGSSLPIQSQQASPYYPSSRLYRNPLYLRVEKVGRLPSPVLQKFLAQGGALNRERLINRNEIFRLKNDALKILYGQFRGHPGFDRYCFAEGIPLRRFAIFCTLAEKYGSGWTRWPAQYQHPDSPALTAFAAQNENRIGFHQWLQWHLDRQSSQAARELPMVQDLPVGFDPGGADAWLWQDLLAKNVSVGAPPDAFNTQGQNWGLPPFVPHKLRAVHYEPFRQTIRNLLKHSGGLRIDHVMGLFRLFWIPNNVSARDGAYVRYAAAELLSIVAIESHRAKATIIGEDLGTVEPGVRDKLSQRKILSYRVMWFQPGLTSKTPRQCLSTVTTHDLPTIPGLWNGTDLAMQKKLGLRPNTALMEGVIRQLCSRLKISPQTPLREVVLRAYAHLAKSQSMLLTATLEDPLLVDDRPNVPGTVNEHPNWSLSLPESLEAIQKNRLLREVAQILSAACQKNSPRQLKR